MKENYELRRYFGADRIETVHATEAEALAEGQAFLEEDWDSVLDPDTFDTDTLITFDIRKYYSR